MAAKRTPLSYDALKQAGLALPEVQESTSYGTPALKLRGKLMARLREDNETVVLRCAWEQRDQWLTVLPTVFHITDHYRSGPWVLLSLAAADAGLAHTALQHAWRCCATPAMLKKLDAAGGFGAAGPIS